MGTLAFFPWLRLTGPVTLEGVQLVPFRRGSEPGGAGTELQQTVDAVLEPYLAPAARPIEEATVVSLAGQRLTDSIGDEALRELFGLSELIAFSGLAVRQFFNPLSLGYLNRDFFSLVVQKFDDPRGGVSLTSRRRDGTRQTYVTRDAYRVERPRHVSSLSPVELDQALLRSLMQGRGADNGRYFESIAVFNRANTDGNDVSPEVELILIAGAFQRLLECQSAKVEELASKFVRVFTPSGDLPLDAPSAVGILKRPKRPWPRSIREAWIRDLYVLRGDPAHGRTTPRYQADWSLPDHLLLAAYAFPRLVKLCLAEQRLYELTNQDRSDIDMFEELARHEVSRPTVEAHGEQRWPWNTIRTECSWRRAAAGVRAALSRTPEDPRT